MLFNQSRLFSIVKDGWVVWIRRCVGIDDEVLQVNFSLFVFLYQLFLQLVYLVFVFKHFLNQIILKQLVQGFRLFGFRLNYSFVLLLQPCSESLQGFQLGLRQLQFILQIRNLALLLVIGVQRLK